MKYGLDYIIGGTCVVGFGHGSCSSEASRGCSGVNKQMDLVFYLFLTGIREVTEPSDTSIWPLINQQPNSVEEISKIPLVSFFPLETFRIDLRFSPPPRLLMVDA